MSLEIKIDRKYKDMPNLEIDLTREEDGRFAQIIYDAIEKHLTYLNEVIAGLRTRVQASLRRMDLMETNN